MSRTTIQIKKEDREILQKYMLKHGLKRTHEAFSKLISNMPVDNELISSEAPKEETYKKTYKQEAELISSDINLKPVVEVLDRHTETLNQMLGESNESVSKVEALKQKLRERLPNISIQAKGVEDTIEQYRAKRQ